MAASMFDRYGGFMTISKIVMSFYDKVLDSDIVGGHFENTDMRVQIDHQTKFISAVMGGPASYTNASLERIHANITINKTHFEEIIALLTDTFEDFELEPADIDIIITDLRDRAHFIINSVDA